MGILDKLKGTRSAGAKKETAKKAETKKAPAKAKSVKKSSDAPVAAQTKVAKVTGDAYKVLIRPFVTEKSTYLASQGKYVFEVAGSANKIQIAQAITDLYGVTPVGVNVVRVRGKVVAYGRSLGKRKDIKKAIVTLPQGKTIEVFEGV